MDISALSYDKWLHFVFDHPVEIEAWHFSNQWDYDIEDPQLVLEYLTRLFEHPEIVKGQFSPEQLDQGFWFIPGPNGFLWLVCSPSIPWVNRRKCIQAIYPLFDRLLGSLDCGASRYMWWDSVFTYCASSNNDIISDKQVLEVVVDVLAKLAKHPSVDVQASARHGIEHLAAIAKAPGNLDIERVLMDCGIVIS